MNPTVDHTAHRFCSQDTHTDICSDRYDVTSRVAPNDPALAKWRTLVDRRLSMRHVSSGEDTPLGSPAAFQSEPQQRSGGLGILSYRDPVVVESHDISDT